MWELNIEGLYYRSI